MFDFCRDVEKYLSESRDNVVAIHCKAGKGRTGVMICAYFLYTHTVPDSITAMAKFGLMRTSNGKGVTIPSQKRYVGYFETCCADNQPPEPPMKVFKTLTITDVPNYDLATGCQPYCNIYQDNIFLYTSKPLEGAPQLFRRPPCNEMGININIPVKGDIKVEVNHFDRVFHQDSKIFVFTFNTAFIDASNVLKLSRTELDGAHKTKDLRVFQSTMEAILVFEDFVQEAALTAAA